MKMEYNPKDFESKWQERWFKDLFYEAEDFAKGKEKYYLLAEFPYPSGDSMHMGHTRNYCMMDTIARLRRMLGQNVLFPMGWDAFGLPTENYAIKVKRPPQEITEENVNNFRKQQKSLGLSFDWSREVNTTDPEYYKWTQWIFLKLYEKGLAYKTKMPINWCPKCKVGCANEEVINGKHERCGEDVEKRDMSQWFLKITEYADRLDDDLDMTDYWESVKVRQRNWIGRKTWYDIEYDVEGTDEKVKVSTTRPDTQFGSTFVVIAPEHEVVEKLKKYMGKKTLKVVEKYQEESRKKSELERMSEIREKTGVNTGLFCINSITQERMPIYVADFVLTTVGTGCVISVPAHDKRDFEFAQKFNIPVIRVIKGPNGDRSDVKSVSDVYEGEGILFNSDFLDGLTSQEAKEKVGEYIKEKGIGNVVVRYHLRDWNFSRQRYWGEPIPIVYCEKCGEVPIPEDQLPVELPKVESYEPTETGESPLANITQWVNIKCPKCGGSATRETDTMPNWAGSSWYYLRYTDPNNSDRFADVEKTKYWLPVDYYEGGSEHVTLHLLYSRFWHKVLYDIGVVTTPEPYQKRTIHGNVLGEDGQKMSKSLGNVITPDELIHKYGADVIRGYMMFMGPYEGDVSWSTETINGIKRFVSKYYRFLLSSWENEGESSGDVTRSVERLVKRVESDILNLKFNTCISALIEFFNEFHKEEFSKEDLEKLLICSAPIFPHLTEEIWERTGHVYSIHMQDWPEVDESTLHEENIEIPVQINGKVRGRLIIKAGSTQEEVKQKVFAEELFEQYLEGKEIKKFVYIQDRILNVVV
ncbi:MAG: leucine--tRNA ligase [Candidatus Dojkabacteria bacterium]|jgi:leucyl-tRNA synthetase